MQIQRYNTTPQSIPNFGINIEPKDINGLGHITTASKITVYEAASKKTLEKLGSNHIGVKLDIRKIKSGVYLTLQGLGIYRERIATTTITREANEAITKTKFSDTLKVLGEKILEEPSTPSKSYSSREI